ncbi:EAL domain-containing protein [Chromobacterium piscinae]|uniref:EAL domain-containing protein n=1 Tax=Chromobacterium piscinae TaxID=686831 RepID=A0ABV0GZL3_9NEIS|nr:EAL domain-containing protein [Chromobacterium piscinae]MBX9298172.1 EAL domain-containing protein [Chromobacterium vaccinii]MBX9348178.1 EAL domain-containing protein [Chromobacterium vaccinii]MBX9355597.1 EAL domain-containing protein [Chromobacterium vaccinii]MCD4506387.1 EAL domain-containing protein [Chromobacterium piscinae]MCD5330489.1 EAL domain-containing protein [Chromobacterium piscinae]
MAQQADEKSTASTGLNLRDVFLIAVILGLLIPASIISYLSFNIQKDNLTTQLETDQRRLLDIVALGMQEPLWNLSRQAGNPLIASVMEDPRVISIRVTDTQSNQIFLSAVRSERRIGSVSYVEKPVIYRGEAIGQVTMEFDNENLAIALSNQVKNILMILAAQLVLSIMLIMSILHSRFLSPMRLLTEQARLLAELKLDSPFEWSRRDELGRLGTHLEWTRSELKRLVDELRAKTLALEADIARRREVEDALRRSENKYRELFWSNLDGIVISSLDGQVIDANPAFLNLMCYSLDQLKQQNFWSLVADESEALERFNLDNKVLRFGYCDEFEATYLNRFDNQVPVSVKTVAMRDAFGRINAVWRMVRDISEKRAAEERVQLAAKVFENTVEGIMITDADRRIRSVNRAFTEITGYTQHEVLGQKTSILSSGRHDEPFYEQMWQSISEQGSWQGELWNRRKNGEVYPEWLAINAVRNSLGEITHYVAIFSDLTERKAADERIQFLAHFDVLTSLPNRIHMQDRVELAIHNVVRDNQRLALLLLDLDRFKTVNESLGHSAGDTLLQVAADRIRSALAPGEMLARQGGDEFIILLPVISDPGEAALAAERVRDVFANPIELHNHVLTITPSIGISVYPDDGRDYETLVRNADAAMYHAKSSGRNSYKFYTADLNARAREILAIESQLRFALERDEFVLHYQPQVEMESGRIVGAEALIRWNHPSLGLLGPVRFIQVAEERGFIVQIGNWVISEATRQLVAWRQEGLPELTLAINLSALQFRQPDLALQVKQALESSGLPGHALDIEVTESIIMEDAQATIQTIDNMKNMGLRLSIDDFGTGYSSLSYLKRFKADKLKIDRSFVRDIPHDADDSAIARAIINMAKNLNMQVVAEGVETMEQWQFLEQEGCDFVQGYLIAKPLPADDFAKLLHKDSLLPQS